MHSLKKSQIQQQIQPYFDHFLTFFDLDNTFQYECKKTTHPLLDNVVMKLLILISKILNDFSPAGISVEVFKVVLV